MSQAEEPDFEVEHPEEGANPDDAGLSAANYASGHGALRVHNNKASDRRAKELGEIAELLKRCRDDFELFNRAILGRPPCWSRQLEIARSVVDHRETLVASGNATGKTWLAAGLILWYLYTRPRSLVVVSGPSQTSLGAVTFKEVRRAFHHAKRPLGGTLSNSVSAAPSSFSPPLENLGAPSASRPTRSKGSRGSTAEI